MHLKLLFTFILFLNIFNYSIGVIKSANGFIGTAELVHNYRKSRVMQLHEPNDKKSVDNFKTITSTYDNGDSSDSEGAIINNSNNNNNNNNNSDFVDSDGDVTETSKNYNNLIDVNSRKLSDKQQVLLQRIVERVARLGGAALLSEYNHNNTTSAMVQDGGAATDSVEILSSASTIEGRNNKLYKKTTQPISTTSTTTSSATSTSNLNINNKSTISATTSPSPTTQQIQLNQSKPSNNNTAINSQKIINYKNKQSNITSNNDNNNLDDNSIVNGNDTEVIFGNVNTSSIVDSLSNDNAREDIYNTQQILPNSNNDSNKKREPTAKPTKYHHYPHNQHIYLLPECAIQQVCNAVYVRFNYTQPLCACPSRYRDPCSASINEDDLHTTKLVGDKHRKAITLAKTCESTTEMRECRSPRDWSLLALQNTRTGKSHYLVICKCPDNFQLEGPMAHDQPTYASVPGIRVFGMMCIKPGISYRRPQIPPKRDNPYYQYKFRQQQLKQQQQQQQQQQLLNYNSNLNEQPLILQNYHLQQQQPQQQQQIYQQNQYKNNYQYLHRLEAATINPTTSGSIYNNYDANSHHQFDLYGRQNKEEHFETTDNLPNDDATEQLSSTQQQQEIRTKRNANFYSLTHDDDDVDNKDLLPVLEWNKIKKLISDIHWD